jgi:hypothetical protein
VIPVLRLPRAGRLALVFALAGLATAAALAVRAPAAKAVTDGCTYTDFPFRYVCFQIHGYKRYVEKFVVVRGKLDGGGICNYRGRVVVRAPSGRTWRYRSTYRPGCQPIRATRTIYVTRRYPDNSHACGSFYENGELQDTACLWIHD